MKLLDIPDCGDHGINLKLDEMRLFFCDFHHNCVTFVFTDFTKKYNLNWLIDSLDPDLTSNRILTHIADSLDLHLDPDLVW